jgi:transposase
LISQKKEKPMSGRKKRKSWKAEEKLRIVLAGLDGTIEVSELCRREGINPTQYYGWKKHLMNSASQVFADERKKKSTTDDRFAAELRRKDAVIAAITAENLELKKTF